MCFLLIPGSAKFEDFTTCLCFKLCPYYRPAMKTASPTATTPHSTRSFQLDTTSTPALGGAESLSEDPSFEASMEFDHSMEDERAQRSVGRFYTVYLWV